MDDKASRREGFRRAADLQFAEFLSEQDIGRNAYAYEQNRRAYFKSEGWRVAGYALDLLIEKTRGKLRDDGVTPEWIHSARTTELLDSLTRGGFLNRKEVEARYGSFEICICDQLLHDLGENESITPHFLKNYFHYRIVNEKDPTYTGAQRGIDLFKIPLIQEDFSLLTYDPAEAFNYYLLRMLRSGYAFLTKLGDRNDNLATMPGLKCPDWNEIDMSSPRDVERARRYFERIEKYERGTTANFSTNDLIGQARVHHPLLSKAFEGLDHSMGFLCVMIRAYAAYHPFHPYNIPGKGKWNDAKHVSVDQTRYYRLTGDVHKFMHPGARPPEMILARLHKEAEQNGLSGLKFDIQTPPVRKDVRYPSMFEQVFKSLGRTFNL